MKLTDKLLAKLEKRGDVFQLQTHIESFKAKDKSILRATMLDPKTIYPSLSKTAKAKKQTSHLLFRLYADHLFHSHDVTAASLHTVPLGLMRRKCLQDVLAALLRKTPSLFRNLASAYRHYLQQVAVEVEPTNLWFLNAYSNVTHLPHTKHLQDHYDEEAILEHMQRGNGSVNWFRQVVNLAQAVLPFEKAASLFCNLFARDDHLCLRHLNQLLAPHQHFTVVLRPPASMLEEATRRHYSEERKLNLLLGFLDPQNKLSCLDMNLFRQIIDMQ